MLRVLGCLNFDKCKLDWNCPAKPDFVVSKESLLSSVGVCWGNHSDWTLAFVNRAGLVRLCVMFLVYAVIGQKSVFQNKNFSLQGLMKVF